MDGKTLEQIRESLIARRRKIGVGIMRERQMDTIEANETQAEIIDIAQNLEQLDRDTSLAEQERREIEAIDHALSKISVGTFGVCEDCDEEIPPKRLQVVPEARFCARCQATIERQQQRSRGAPGLLAG